MYDFFNLLFSLDADKLLEIMKALLEYAANASKIPKKLFILMRAFLKLYLSQMEHWDNHWKNDLDGQFFLRLVESLLANLKKCLAILPENRDKPAITALVGFCMTVCSNYQQILRMEGQNGGKQPFLIDVMYDMQAEIVDCLIDSRFDILDDECFFLQFERFLDKDIDLNGYYGGIRKIF